MYAHAVLRPHLLPGQELSANQVQCQQAHTRRRQRIDRLAQEPHFARRRAADADVEQQLGARALELRQQVRPIKAVVQKVRIIEN